MDRVEILIGWQKSTSERPVKRVKASGDEYEGCLIPVGVSIRMHDCPRTFNLLQVYNTLDSKRRSVSALRARHLIPQLFLASSQYHCSLIRECNVELGRLSPLE